MSIKNSIIHIQNLLKGLNRLLLGSLDLESGCDETSNKELTEEEEVTSIHEESGNDNTVIHIAVRVGLVVVVSQDSDVASSNHLGNLHESNPHRIEPLGLPFHGHQKVVGVHDSMNSVL